MANVMIVYQHACIHMMILPLLVNDIFHILKKCHWPINDSVSKKSGWCLLVTVIDRSMTFFISSKIVIDRSMTIFINTLESGALLGNCHWPVNDNFTYGHLAYGHFSLTGGQWHLSIKESQKIVIDRWSMTKKSSLTGCILSIETWLFVKDGFPNPLFISGTKKNQPFLPNFKC